MSKSQPNSGKGCYWDNTTNPQQDLVKLVKIEKNKKLENVSRIVTDHVKFDF